MFSHTQGRRNARCKNPREILPPSSLRLLFAPPTTGIPSHLLPFHGTPTPTICNTSELAAENEPSWTSKSHPTCQLPKLLSYTTCSDQTLPPSQLHPDQSPPGRASGFLVTPTSYLLAKIPPRGMSAGQWCNAPYPRSASSESPARDSRDLYSCRARADEFPRARATRAFV